MPSSKTQSVSDKRAKFRTDILFVCVALVMAALMAQASRSSSKLPPSKISTKTPGLSPGTTAWISQEKTPLRAQPGLNLPVTRTMKKWEEVTWLDSLENWDQIRVNDGSKGWVQSKYVQFSWPDPSPPPINKPTLMGRVQ